MSRSARSKRLVQGFFVMGLVVAGGAVAWWLVVLSGAVDATLAGQAGDSVAWATALLTACALFAALESVRLQRRELALQRKEMRASADELRRQANALALQSQATALQAQVEALKFYDDLKVRYFTALGLARSELRNKVGLSDERAVTYLDECADQIGRGESLESPPELPNHIESRIRTHPGVRDAIEHYGLIRSQWRLLTSITDQAIALGAKASGLPLVESGPFKEKAPGRREGEPGAEGSTA